MEDSSGERPIAVIDLAIIDDTCHIYFAIWRMGGMVWHRQYQLNTT